MGVINSEDNAYHSIYWRCSPIISRRHIEFIQLIINREGGSMEIFTGDITTEEMKGLKKHFRVISKPYGYTEFKKLVTQ